VGLGNDPQVTGLGNDPQVTGLGNDSQVTGLGNDPQVTGLGNNPQVTGLGNDSKPKKNIHMDWSVAGYTPKQEREQALLADYCDRRRNFHRLEHCSLKMHLG
jgi:hypothetical protein